MIAATLLWTGTAEDDTLAPSILAQRSGDMGKQWGTSMLVPTDSSIVTVSTPTSRDLAEQRRAIALMSTTHCLRSGELLISSLRLSGDGHCVRSIDRVRSTTQQHDRARDGRARFRQPSCPVLAEQRRLKSRAQPAMTGPVRFYALVQFRARTMSARNAVTISGLLGFRDWSVLK